MPNVAKQRDIWKRKNFIPENRRTVSDRKKLDQPQGAGIRQARYGKPGKEPYGHRSIGLDHRSFRLHRHLLLDRSRTRTHLYIFMQPGISLPHTRCAISIEYTSRIILDHLQVHKKSFEIERQYHHIRCRFLQGLSKFNIGRIPQIISFPVNDVCKSETEFQFGNQFKIW